MKVKYYFFAALLIAVCIATAFTMKKTDQVKHIVVFKYKADATPAQIKETTDFFKGLQKTIPGIVSFEHGINSSTEGLNQGYTHIYLLTFENAAARDAYLPHPEHKKFGELLTRLNVLDGKPFVVDFQAVE
jgi:hypothetical protein